jgi:predicted MFS family arabinose efflux permease
VANLYYAQPIIAAIAPAVGIKPDLAGAVVSVTQIGYGTGLFLLVPLADLVENRRLVLSAIGVTVVALAVLALGTGTLTFFVASFVVGISSTAAQILVPFVAHLVPAARSGRAVGNVMAGLLTGIMLARPIALFIAGAAGWRAVFATSAILIIVVGVILGRLMPVRNPGGGIRYREILLSMIALLRQSRAIRRRALYQSLLFAAFNLFWTAAPIMLAERFGLSEREIAIFALAGAGGALAAPLAGRLADRGYIRAATVGSMIAVGLSFLGTIWLFGWGGLIVLTILTVILDAAVQTNQVVSQRIVFSVPPQVRGRANGIYVTLMFVGGALGSLVGTVSYQWGGWTTTATIGAVIGAVALLAFTAERS